MVSISSSAIASSARRVASVILNPSFISICLFLFCSLLLRLVQSFGLSAAETACERCRLASRDGVIHEMVVVTDPIVVRALKPFDLSYHSRPEIGFMNKETNGYENLLHEFHFFGIFLTYRGNRRFFKKVLLDDSLCDRFQRHLRPYKQKRTAMMKKLVIFSGAGMSQESGLPTFRGKDGLWESKAWTKSPSSRDCNRNGDAREIQGLRSIRIWFS